MMHLTTSVTQTQGLTKSDTLRNARLFVAWYQSIPLMLNYWTGSKHAETIVNVMATLGMDQFTIQYHAGVQARSLALVIAKTNVFIKPLVITKLIMD